MTDQHEPNPKTSKPPRLIQRIARQGWRGKLKIVLYALLPAIILVCVAETVVRLGGFDRPVAGSIFFGHPGQPDPIHRADPDLFYSLKPNRKTTWQGATVTTNQLGLRGSDIQPKQANEFRILCLGESSTFGAMVGDAETYAARLEELLSRESTNRNYRVINAGVSGYTSFQSLKYLELRGLKLQPDLVLFYHEFNDLLPAEFSDRELHESQSHAWHRALANHLAIYRVISNATARWKIANKREEIQSQPNEDPSPDPEASGKRTRVSDRERRENLQRLQTLCQQHNTELVIMHPAYADSQRHRCVLTEFCEETGVPLYESHDALHPAFRGKGDLFADECHPNAEGHQALAEGLFLFLKSSGLLRPNH